MISQGSFMRSTISLFGSTAREIPFLLVLALFAFPACSAEQPAGVKPYSGLELGDVSASSSKQWQLLLSEPWKLGGDPVTLSVSNQGSVVASVDSCTKLFEAVDKNMQAEGPDKAIFDGWAVQCYAVRALVAATVPKNNFVGSFSLDEKGIKALPVGLALQISRDDERKVASITSKGGTLGSFFGSMTLKLLGKAEDREVIVQDDSSGTSQLLSVLAEGDFDHDGINDLLISSEDSMTGGSYSAAHLYVVSRLDRGGPLVLREQLR